MTCTFCGSYLDGTESECPYCGHKISSQVDEAPVSPRKSSAAADFTSKFSARSNPEPEINDDYSDSYEARGRKYASSSNTKANSSMILLIGIAGALLLSLASLFVCIGINSKVSDMKQDILSQLYQIQTAQNEISYNLSSVGSTVGNIGTTIEQSNLSKNITITKQPTEVTTWVGRGAANTEGETLNQLLFSVEASGSNLSYEWQKFDQASGSWVSITFDPNTSNNEGFGLHVYNLPNGTGSQLAACGLTSNAFGSYRCVISDNNGVQYSDVVTISEREKP